MIQSNQPITSLNMTAHTDVQRTVQAKLAATEDSRVLNLTNLLQTTLELDQQINLLADAVRREMDVTALAYQHTEDDLQLCIGRTGGHKAHYDLVIEQQSLGKVSVYRERPFTDDELADLESMLCVLVYPLRNALAYRHAVQRALRDPLTGVQNRNALDSALGREIETSRRHGSSLSMLVLDIDHFKHINDTHGHSFGDDVLKAVAHTAETTIRRCDEIFRFGGEEFVVLARFTDETGARQLAERIRKDIEAIGTVNGQDAGVTVSIGIAVMPPADSADNLFDRADQALYQAKQEGRNRWVMAP